MDIADEAQELEELSLKLALNNRDKVAQLPAVGICHYCSEHIECGEFCDADCRDDYERINNR